MKRNNTVRTNINIDKTVYENIKVNLKVLNDENKQYKPLKASDIINLGLMVMLDYFETDKILELLRQNDYMKPKSYYYLKKEAKGGKQ